MNHDDNHHDAVVVGAGASAGDDGVLHRVAKSSSSNVIVRSP
jgi:hypothetical protein